MNSKNIITTNTIYESQDEYTKYSVSKIKTYKDCSQMYKLKYVDKLDTYVQSTATLTGTLLHSTLEYLYGVEDDEVETAQDAFFKILSPEFANLGIVSAESILGELLDYHRDITHLYERASANYRGIDAIRTGKGEVPKAPEMTGIWKSECKRLKLDERKYLIDHTIQTSKTGLENVSITDVFSNALKLASIYNTPAEFESILHLELPLSTWDKNTNTLINAVPFPQSKHKNIFLNGFVDNVAKVQVNGKIYTAVIDYKSSKEEFNTSIVEHNQQLLMYAAGVQYLLKEPVEYIGIFSFKKNKLILAPVDKNLQKELILLFNKIINKTIKKDFTKHFPDTKYSTCLNSFGGTCPFLENCWPKSFEFLNKNNLSEDISDFYNY
jgi:hypothetical protein